MAKFIQKVLSKGDEKKYEQAKALIQVSNKAAEKWWEAINAVKENQWFLSEFPTFKEWCEKYSAWSWATVLRALSRGRQAKSRKLIADTTGEPEMKPANVTESTNNTQTTQSGSNSNNKPTSSTPPKKQKILDAMGVPIPEPCLPIWNRRQEIQDLMTQVSRIKCLIEEKKKHGDKLFMKISQHGLEAIDKFYGYLSIAKPQTVCGTCGGRLETRGGICSACGSTGLQSLDEYKRFTPVEEQSLRIKTHEPKGLPAGVS